MKPQIFRREPKLKTKNRSVDAYSCSVKELFFLENPKLKKGEPGVAEKLKRFLLAKKITPLWIYYPDKQTVVKSVDEKTYFKLRTGRNKNLITEKEQLSFRNMCVGIAGLSVGSNILSALSVSGGAKSLKIADFDTLEVTNLNRIRGALTDIGTNKTEIAARQVWEVDPFAEIELYKNGLNEKNLQKFLAGKPKLDVFIDEMDSLQLKILARQLCKKYKIPVLMATDNGDSVVLDIERFDLEPKREIFHGLLGGAAEKPLSGLNYRQWLALATKIVGPEYLTPAMQSSLLQIGKTLAAVPQLGAVASVAGAAMVLALRRMAGGQKMPSGRYVISLEEKLLPGYFAKNSIADRKKQTDNFKKQFLKNYA